MKEHMQIEILDPKVKGILYELQSLGLITIKSNESSDKKLSAIKKLGGKNLVDLDTDTLDKIIKNR